MSALGSCDAITSIFGTSVASPICPHDCTSISYTLVTFLRLEERQFTPSALRLQPAECEQRTWCTDCKSKIRGLKVPHEAGANSEAVFGTTNLRIPENQNASLNPETCHFVLFHVA